METCKDCSNKAICVKQISAKCDHYDVAFTRSEIINMILNTDESLRAKLLDAVASTYKLKMAF